MIRQVCPHCSSTVSLPDTAAGGDSECPSCGKSFPVPSRYTPMVAVEKPPEPPAPPPPPPVEAAPPPIPDRPPPPPGLVELMPTTASTPAPGYTHQRSVKLCPSLVGWTPVVGLVVVLVLTFFPWVGMFPGGYSGYTQTAWGAMVGKFTHDHVVEDMLKLDAKLRERVRWDWVMIPYLFGLVFATFLAVTDRIFHKPTAAAPKMVAWMGSLWTRRSTVLTALAVALLALLVIQMMAGFGLENGIEKVVADRYAEQRQQAGDVTADQNRITIREEMDLASLSLQRTTWFAIAFWLNILIVVALLGQIALDRRGSKPPPRLVVEY